MTPYRHTQFSALNLVLLGIPTAVCVYVAFTIPVQWGTWLALGVAALFITLGVLFHSLTIQVDTESVRLHFGPGLIRKSWSISDCTAASHVTTALWEGWGIRLTSRGWLYNVAIPDAIMIRLGNGTAGQLGTDEPQALLAALKNAGVETPPTS